MEKPEGVRKHLWDYSIDLIGPGERAQAQIAACQARGIPCYLKSEPESSYEATAPASHPHAWTAGGIALRRWRLLGPGVHGFSPRFAAATRPVRARWISTPGGRPRADKDDALRALAARIAGPAATDHVRVAWSKVSEAIPWVPELPAYYTGPSYLGPAAADDRGSKCRSARGI